MRLISWNVNGIRAVAKKGFLNWLAASQPDVLCLQETKAWPEQVPPDVANPEGYHAFWSMPAKKGYSGVATFTKHEPLKTMLGLGDERFDSEGRVVMTEFKEFCLFNVYFPNGKASPERLRFKLDFYDRFLDVIEEARKSKPVVFCGDVNTAHMPIDLEHPKANEDVSGFLPIEREWMDMVIDLGYVDSFRHFDKSQKNIPGGTTRPAPGRGTWAGGWIIFSFQRISCRG